MPSALSADLRERVVVTIEAGASRREAARRFEVSPASAVRWHEASCGKDAHGPSRWAAISARTPSRPRLT